ncbi:MAG: glycogen-binding domain-containing protein [Gemmatimonadales bacterium]
MHDRIQRALDGELPVDGLTPAERDELQSHRAIVGIALEPIRQLPAIDVTRDVMRLLRPQPGPVRRALAAAARWLWSPRALTLRPAYALAGALAVAAVLSTTVLRPATPLSPPAGAPARVLVQFRLGDTQAHEVALVGDFNGWHPEQRLHQVEPGVWSVDVALEPGVYHYVFMVDGKAWRLDPLAPRVTDGFGGASSRVSVLAPEARS